ncbi:MAG: COQ9 family protein [Alphaproteobacteria bacterium]|nr:COQ9 family protein [Alphaproteobacteria bacterium]
MKHSAEDLSKEMLINAALRQVPFEGWTRRALEKAEEAEGLQHGTFAAYFPGGIQDFIKQMHQWVDSEMQRKIAAQPDFETSKIREKIYRCVMARIETLTPHREAMRRLAGHQLLPWNKPWGLRDLGSAADAMWKLAGDRSVDYNFYTKRILLSGVYVSTLNHWFDDMSDEFESTKTFLRARIENVLKFGKFVGGIKERFAKKAA